MCHHVYFPGSGHRGHQTRSSLRIDSRGVAALPFEPRRQSRASASQSITRFLAHSFHGRRALVLVLVLVDDEAGDTELQGWFD